MFQFHMGDDTPNFSRVSTESAMMWQMALPAGLSPATATFEASHSGNLSYGSVEIGELPRIRTVLCGLRVRCIASMLATQTRHEGGVEPPSRFGIGMMPWPAPVFASRKYPQAH